MTNQQHGACPTRFGSPHLIGGALAASAAALALVGCAPAPDDTEPSITGYVQGAEIARDVVAMHEDTAVTPPAAFRTWIDDLPAALCDHPAVTSDLVEAQLAVESGFDTGAVGPGGTLGPAQIPPGTWAVVGRDIDGNGTTDPHDIADAVGALVTQDCDIARDLGPAADPHRIAATYTGGIYADHPVAVAAADRVLDLMAARSTALDGGPR